MRLPRKLKKQAKKKVAKKNASKMVMSAIVTVQTQAQCAIIGAMPSFERTAIVEKTLKVVQTVADGAKAIQRIMLEPPNSWRDFAK